MPGDKTVHLVNRRRVTAHGRGPAREGVLGNDDRAGLIGVDHEVDAPARNRCEFDRPAVGSARPMQVEVDFVGQQAGHEPGGSGIGALIEGDGTGSDETKPVVDDRSDAPEVRLTVRRCDHEGFAR
jgi:hypothetical protein